MQTRFLGKEYLVLALIKWKNHFFQENFITSSELSRFEQFLQQEFNNLNLNVIIASASLSAIDFETIGDIIMLSDTCGCNLDLLPMDISTILYDSNMMSNFFQVLEKEKLEKIELNMDPISKLHTK